MAESARRNNPDRGWRVLCGLWNLYYHSHIQSRPAARTTLSAGHARPLPAQIQIGRDGMGANGTVYLPGGVFGNECIHDGFLTSSDAI